MSNVAHRLEGYEQAEAHIHIRGNSDKIVFLGSRNKAEELLNKLQDDFNISKVSLGEKAESFISEESPEAWFMDLGECDRSCFYMHIPDATTAKDIRVVLEDAPLDNVTKVNVVGKGDCKRGCNGSRRPPSSLQ